MNVVNFSLISWILYCVNVNADDINPGHDVNEDDDMAYLLNNMYRKPVYEHDPFDMISPPPKKKAMLGSHKAINSNMETSEKKLLLDEDIDNMEVLNELNLCKKSKVYVEKSLETEKSLTIMLQKKLMQESITDIEVFYNRIIKRLWTLLQMENMLERKDEAAYHLITAQVSKQDATAFKEYIENKKDYLKIDDFFYSNLKVEDYSDSKSHMNLEDLLTFEALIYLFGSILFMLVFWTITLLILDIHKNRRWKSVVAMLFFILFIISCLFHWRHMVKQRVSQRHSKIMQQQNKNIPAECLEGDSYLIKLKLYIFGGVSTCEQHFNDIMIEPFEEISPLMVISETFTLFIFQPLEGFGSHSGKFFKEFFIAIPLMHLVPAVMIFLVLMLVFILTFFNYGIEFPFWMGGIKPFSVKHSEVNREEIEYMIKDNINQLKVETDVFLKQAKEMLLSISQVAIEASHNPTTQNVLNNSADLINSQLEELIRDKFKDAVVHVRSQKSLEHMTSRRLSIDHNNPSPGAIKTITSTPVNKYLTSVDSLDGQFGETGADAVHHRFRNNKEEASPSSAEDCSSSAYARQRSIEHNNKENTPSIILKSPSRVTRSKTKDVKGTESISTKSPVASNEPSSFMLQVKSVLEQSVSPDISQGNSSQENSDEEMNLSVDSKEFLQKVKKVMTP